MTTTRISKIARLPHTLREQLNHRLQNGELGRTLLKWLNNEPETKRVMADLFSGASITHQNLSDWRRTGYQDWLMHHQNIEWLDRITENDAELKKRENDNDSFEALGRIFIIEIAQGLAALQQIKNPHDRSLQMQNLAREFARLQNAYNRSRRVALEWDKFNGPDETTDPSEVPDHSPFETPPVRPSFSDGENSKPGIQTGGASVLASRPRIEPPEEVMIEVQPETASNPAPKRQGTGALQDAPRTSEALDPRASVLDCGSPLPLCDVNSQTPPPFQPIPAPAPTTPPLLNSQHTPTPRPSKPHISPVPIRGRRFVCIEG